jgi:hypothetical protein
MLLLFLLLLLLLLGYITRKAYKILGSKLRESAIWQ